MCKCPPLTTISGYAQLMEKNGPGDEELFYTGTEHILKESPRLHRMALVVESSHKKAGYFSHITQKNVNNY